MYHSTLLVEWSSIIYNMCTFATGKIPNYILTDHQSNFFTDKDGILRRRLKTIDGIIYQIVLPKSLLPEVREAGHDHHWSGHQGYARTCHR